MAYSGVRVGTSQTAEFTPVASYPGLTADVRARLGEMKVAPVTAEMVANDAPSPDDQPRRRTPPACNACAAENPLSPKSQARRNAELIHRPTMTPITFGADRYFSSIAARAAARFSGVSRPRFSARIIQQ